MSVVKNRFERLKKDEYRKISEEVEEHYDDIDDGWKEINDGRKKLDDARKEIEDGEKKIKDNRKKLADAKKTLDDSKKKLSDAEKQLSSAKTQLASGKTVVLAPEGFLEHAVSENLYCGPAMGRRAQYQYGAIMSPGTTGRLAIGIGLGQSVGTVGLLAPTYEICSNETIVIDGLEIQFQLTPGTVSVPLSFPTLFRI